MVHILHNIICLCVYRCDWEYIFKTRYTWDVCLDKNWIDRAELSLPSVVARVTKTHARTHTRGTCTRCMYVEGKKRKEKKPCRFQSITHRARLPRSPLPAVVVSGGGGSYSPPVARTPRAYAPRSTPSPPHPIRLRQRVYTVFCTYIYLCTVYTRFKFDIRHRLYIYVYSAALWIFTTIWRESRSVVNIYI